MSMTLLTISPSHYCEKARWALDRLELSWREEAHAPLMHRPHTLLAAWAQTTPVLVDGTRAVADSTVILEHLDRIAPAHRRLFPEDLSEQADARALEERFDRDLGPATRLLAYFHVLEDRSLAVELMCANVPPLERRVVEGGFPVLRALMKKGLGITPVRAERARLAVDREFAFAADRLADGRPFLAGDRFTAADLTFAALAAPIILAEGYGAPLPPLERLSSEMRALVEGYRHTPAGAFVQRLYASERRPKRTA